MKLTKLTIEMQRWGNDQGKYKGEACFACELGNVEIRLNEDHIERIFQMAADTIIETSREVAAAITCHVIEQREGAQLERK